MDRLIIPLKFKNETLPVDKFNLAKKLLDKFPQYLLFNPNKTFGCPDCADQGGYYIEIKEKNGEVKNWHIDTDTSKQPAEIRAYIEDLRMLLGQL